MTDTERAFWRALDDHADAGKFGDLLAHMGVMADWFEDEGGQPEKGKKLRWLYDNGKYPHKPKAGPVKIGDWRSQWNWYWWDFGLITPLPEHAVIKDCQTHAVSCGDTASELINATITNEELP